MTNLNSDGFFKSGNKNSSIRKKKTNGKNKWKGFKMNNLTKIATAIGCSCVLFLAMFVFFFNVKMIEPGNAGIKIKLSGSDRGVQDVVLVSGRVIYSTFFWRVEEFPTFTQIMNWTKNPQEGNPTDESVTFNSSEGSSINADISVSYHFVSEKIPSIYVKYRKSPEQIMAIDIRAAVRGALDRNASAMKIMEIFGEGKQKLVKATKEELNEEYKEIGIVFETLNFIGRLRTDPKVEEQINMAIAASQRALEAQNKVAEVKAQADQEVAKAEGKARAIAIEAKAKTEANKMISESVTTQVESVLFYEKWDGRLPMVTGGGTSTLVDLPESVTKRINDQQAEVVDIPVVR